VGQDFQSQANGAAEMGSFGANCHSTPSMLNAEDSRLPDSIKEEIRKNAAQVKSKRNPWWEFWL
jgi:hypothetical protein